MERKGAERTYFKYLNDEGDDDDDEDDDNDDHHHHHHNNDGDGDDDFPSNNPVFSKQCSQITQPFY